MAFRFPDDCRTEPDRVYYCLRYQQVQQDKFERGEITEDERMRRIIAIMPHQLKARLDDEAGNYRDAAPTYIRSKGDFDGEKYRNPVNLDGDNPGDVFSHRRVVYWMHKAGAKDSEEIAQITAEQEKARIACSQGTRWDSHIDKVII